MKIQVAHIAFGLAGVMSQVGQAQQYIISTYAGGGPLPLQAESTSVSIDWNSKGLTAGASGDVYFTSLNSVFNLALDGRLRRIAGDGRRGYSGDTGPAISARFSMEQLVASPPYLGTLPPGLTADHDGNVYVADNGNSRVRKISAEGIVSTVAGNGTFGFSGDDGPAVHAELSSVLGLAVNTSGNLLLADSDNHRIRVLAPDGTITTLAGNGVCGSYGDGGPAVNAQLCNPTGIAADAAGNLFIAEAGNGRIRRISPDGIINTVTNAVSAPTNVSVDTSGNLFVVGEDGNFWDTWQAVWKISRDGTVTIVAGHACQPQTAYCPPSPNAGTTPAGTFLGDRLSTAVDVAGNLIVAAPVNRRIYRVFADAYISVYAGSGEYDFSGDGGPATSARLANPGSVAVDRFGSLFVVDYLNNRVRKVSPDRIVTTVAGNGGWGISGDGGEAANASLAAASVTLDTIGNVFIGNYLGGVRKVAPDGTITSVVNTPGPVALDAQGNLFIADAAHGIVKIGVEGTRAVLTASGWVSGLAADNAGNLFFTEFGRVMRISQDGSIVTVAGNGTPGFSGDGTLATDAQVNPTGVAVDATGNLFIADGPNNRIRKVSPEGVITTVAGNGASGYSGDDGAATDAAISKPSGIAVDSLGSVYFADTANSVIRVLRPVR